MENQKVILSRTNNLGDFGRIEDVDYDILNRSAVAHRHGGIGKEETSRSKKRFEEDINVIRRLARKKIAGLHKKIENNKNVLTMFQDDEAELEKTTKHMERNELTLGLLEEFLINK